MTRLFRRSRHALLSLAGVLLALATVPLLTACADEAAEPETAASASADPASDRAAAAASWLSRQLVDGERMETTFSGTTYPDQGLTIDAVLAFTAAGVAERSADQALHWLAEPDVLKGYVGDGTSTSYAGALAKLMLAAQATGRDPSTFGGVDLPARLTALRAPSGRFSDRSADGDFSNAFSQSFAILALDRTREGASQAAVDFLAGSRCPDGSFPLRFGQPTCTGDVDATALAVQALVAADTGPEAGAGAAWLAGVQKPDGGFGAETGKATPNANSTSLAATALEAAGDTDAADKATEALARLQVGCDGPAANRGAVAFDATGFAAATATRATPQAVLGLAGAELATLRRGEPRPGGPPFGCEIPSS